MLSANLAAGPSLIPTIIDLPRDEALKDRDPALKEQEMRATVEAVFWRQRYEDNLAHERAANKRGEHALGNYLIALEQIMKCRTKPGQGSGHPPSDVKGKGEVSERSGGAFDQKGEGEARKLIEDASDRKGKGKAREPSADKAPPPYDKMEED